jgi:predicted unusual protein kinase regulating ubiquinone biosynthesis (AarF/ABC1/UbiB family)
LSQRTDAAQRIYRARRIGSTFARTYLGIRTDRFIARRLQPGDMAKCWARRHRRNAEAIYDTALELHGLILKGCQFVGTRSDAVPEAYVAVLAGLQDRVPPRSFEVARGVVERELERPLEEALAEFDETPVASASLAQVHRARRHDGRCVAVKVQYPEIQALVASDLSNLRGRLARERLRPLAPHRGTRADRARGTQLRQ